MHSPRTPPGGEITRFITFTLSVDVKKQIKSNVTGVTSNLKAVFFPSISSIEANFTSKKEEKTSSRSATFRHLKMKEI